jgi:hypothetical protein
MRSRNAIMGAVASAIVLATAAPTTAMANAAGPSVIQPMTGVGCYGGIGSSTYQECTQVVGSGLKVTSISGEFNNNGPFPATIYIKYYGPKGDITKTGSLTVAPGKSTGYHTWHNPNPTANMTPGDYCTEAFFAGTTQGIISDCIEVHT